MRRVGARAVLAALIASAALYLGAGASWAGGFCGVAGCTGSGNLAGQTLSALGGVRLSSTAKLDPGNGTLAGSEPDADVPPCWYQPGLTTIQAIDLVRNLSRLVRANPDMYPWFEQYIEPMVAADYHVGDAGLWYVAWCSDFDAANAQIWTDQNPWFVWVAKNNPAPAPAGTVELDPETLALYALDSVVLPATKITFNPAPEATVFVPTWIWLDKANYQTVTVTAVAGPVTVTATASPSSLHLPTALPDTSVTPASGTCTDLYDAYTGDASAEPACAITFARSSAQEPGLAYPVSVGLVWSAKFTSNFGAAGALQAGTVTGTGEIPVQEAQTTITR
jgi:hypothetical protein